MGDFGVCGILWCSVFVCGMFVDIGVISMLGVFYFVLNGRIFVWVFVVIVMLFVGSFVLLFVLVYEDWVVM